MAKPETSRASAGRRGILVGGNFIVDRVKLVETYPAEDALTSILSESHTNGGAAFNVLVDLANLTQNERGGTRATPLEAVGRVGDDASGSWILEDCKRRKIDTHQLRLQRGALTSYTDVMSVPRTGRRTFFHYRGANAYLDAKDFDFSKTRAKVLHLGFLLLLDRLDRPSRKHGTVFGEVLAQARKAGLVTAADVVTEASQRYQEVVLPTLPEIDYLFMNELEAEHTTRVKLREKSGRGLSDGLRRAAEFLLARGVRRSVVLHTKDGALASSRTGEAQWQGSVKLPKRAIAGTTGAGDAFAAGFLLGLHEDSSLAESLRYAVCTAAASLGSATPSESVGSLARCLALGKRYGFRPQPR
jgi:sugar/nucleoside kinase (ribokinase family)